MPTGLTTAAANELLDALAATYRFIQLHTGDPGANGTLVVAAEADRLQVTWAPAADATLTSGSLLEWTNVVAAEDYSHFSAWDTATPGAGTCGFTGLVNANAITAGDTFRIAAGGISAPFTVATNPA